MANEETREQWAARAGGWIQNERIFDAALAPFTAAVLGAAEFGPGLRVLDVGCGGGTLLEAAIAAGADAVGVDISPPMVESARRRVPAATVLEADAQSEDLSLVGPFDRVVSRFGVMFFADPVAAFANLRRAAAPGGRLAFVCWRGEESDMFWAGLGPAVARIEEPPTLPCPGSPGPLGLADPDLIARVLADSGWREASIAPVDGWCDYALDGSDGVAERLAIVSGGIIGTTLREALGEHAWADALDEARAELRAHHLRDGRVQLMGRVWLVTATAP